MLHRTASIAIAAKPRRSNEMRRALPTSGASEAKPRTENSASDAAKKLGAQAEKEARMFEPKASCRASRLSDQLFGNPKGSGCSGRLSLITFFGEAKKVIGCRATPGVHQQSDTELTSEAPSCGLQNEMEFSLRANKPGAARQPLTFLVSPRKVSKRRRPQGCCPFGVPEKMQGEAGSAATRPAGSNIRASLSASPCTFSAASKRNCQVAASLRSPSACGAGIASNKNTFSS
jgi:hypothetical protein